jgi:multiple sugar transport system substrate-binding protein
MGQLSGKQYMLPMQVFYIVFYWNKDLFKAAGLDPNQPPKTLQQLSDYAVKLTDASNGQYGLGIPVKTAPATFASQVWGNGGDFVDLKTKKSLLDSPANLKTYSFLADLVANKKVSPQSITGPELDNLMISGKLGMYMNGPWLINGLRGNKINFGIALPPAGSAGNATILDGSTFYIPKTTKAAEKAAVYEFLKYWESPEIVKEWSMRNGFPPYLKAVLQDPQVKADPVLSQMLSFGSVGRQFLPNLKTSSNITSDVLWPLVEQVTTGADVASSLKAASQQIDSLLAGE